VTLGRLFLAWLPVAVLFAVIGGLGPRSDGARATASPDAWTRPGKGWVFAKWDVMWRCAEAGVVTLFASLWFDSLGHGGWWLLFALLGLIVVLARLPGSTTSVAGTPEGGWRRREAVVRTIRDVVRYLLAGAILAWRLG
jgi:hypothetical protein